MALQTAPPHLGSQRTLAHGSLLLLLLCLEKACPPGREAQVVDENLFFYEEWELEACMDGALLATQMRQVNRIPFTYQQLHIFKRKLDEVVQGSARLPQRGRPRCPSHGGGPHGPFPRKFYPQGYPQSLIEHLSYFFLYVTPEDIHKWNVTSLDTVKSLLKVSQGRGVDAQVAALIARYVGGGGELDKAALDTLATFRPAYLCVLRPEQLGSVQLSVLWMTTPQDLGACSSLQMAVLYHKARTAFQNVSGSEYFTRIEPFLGGASTEDLRAFTWQNISIDAAAFKKLPTEAVLSLTVAEVQKLLGPNLVGLKAEAGNMPLRDWISRQSQEDLDRLGLGLVGGVPNGYLVLDLHSREASSGGPHCLGRGPGPVLTVTASLLLVSVLS
ncbi:hypothetical protein MG293_017941 [Ovis ammon polii]|uniref:Mesothelin n=1 Tax=Ovis ammon polii TaxID=230172 RepID=A0AAD4TRR2_OVIAM|nr:hypothetical protein MG293_017941 [Ovis ammon polii]